MERSVILLANFTILAALLSLGSYYALQWFVSNGWRSTWPLFVSGLALALILLGMGILILEFLPQSNFGKLDAAAEGALGWPASSYRRQGDGLAKSFGTRAEPPSASRQPGYPQHKLTPGAQKQSFASASQFSSGYDGNESRTQPSSEPSVLLPTWLADRSFWGATKCVLAIRLDPDDAGTWMLINDCEEDVRILVATCASALDECRQRRSQIWLYVPSGVSLPAKLTRSVSLEEQTVHGLHLRYAACRSRPQEAPAPQDELGALRHVSVQSCDEEVRALSREGASSGLQIEELLNEPVPPNPCCNRSD